MPYRAYFFISFLLYLILFFLSIPGERRSRWLLRIGLVLPVVFNGLTFFAVVVQSGHLPSHFLFERFIELGFGLGMLLWIVSFWEDTRRIGRYLLLMILMVLGLCLIFPMDLIPPIYRYSLVAAQLFFQLEALAFILLVFSSGYFLVYLFEKRNLEKKHADGEAYLQKGRIYLLIGFIVFLASQFSGSIWSLQGWGDYWMWGKNSLAGVVIWFYIMFVIHCRYIYACRGRFEAGVGSLQFLMVLFYRMVWQP
jgi:hypothetical protein